MKPCLIKQPAGIGDVFFCQKIARIMMQHGYKVIWPLRPDIHWIQRYIKDIWFPMTTDDFPMKDIYFRGSGAVVEESGAPDIGEHFNTDGIITLSDEFEVSEEIYESKMDAIQDNLERAKKMEVLEDFIWENYFQ